SLMLVLGSGGRALASPEREALVRLVPDDVAVCFLLGKLPEQGEKLKQSKWFKKVERTPLGKALTDSPELRKFHASLERLAQRLEMPWAKVRDEVFGGPVLLAYRPGPPGQA